MHFLLFLVMLYFLPTLVAALRRTHNVGAVFAVNLLVGWTVIGWFAALLWAALSAPAYVYVYPAPQDYRQY